MAIGTSAGTIIFTGMSSARAHHAKGAVLWSVVGGMAPGIVVGSLIGPQIASNLPPALMSAAFGGFIWFGAYRMLRNKPPVVSRQLPGRVGMAGVGALIGMIAGMVGTGGAFLAVPFMTRCNVRLHAAVATSAAMSIPVAIFAAAGFIIAGCEQARAPALRDRVRLRSRARCHRDHEHAPRAARRAHGARVAGRSLAACVCGDAVLPRGLYVVEGVSVGRVKQKRDGALAPSRYDPVAFALPPGSAVAYSASSSNLIEPVANPAFSMRFMATPASSGSMNRSATRSPTAFETL